MDPGYEPATGLYYAPALGLVVPPRFSVIRHLKKCATRRISCSSSSGISLSWPMNVVPIE